MAALLPALAKVGQVGIELAPTFAWQSAFGKTLSDHVAMHTSTTQMQLSGDGTLAESFARERQDLLVARVAVGATDLPTTLSRRQVWSLC